MCFLIYLIVKTAGLWDRTLLPCTAHGVPECLQLCRPSSHPGPFILLKYMYFSSKNTRAARRALASSAECMRCQSQGEGWVRSCKLIVKLPVTLQGVKEFWIGHKSTILANRAEEPFILDHFRPKPFKVNFKMFSYFTWKYGEILQLSRWNFPIFSPMNLSVGFLKHLNLQFNNLKQLSIHKVLWLTWICVYLSGAGLGTSLTAARSDTSGLLSIIPGLSK